MSHSSPPPFPRWLVPTRDVSVFWAADMLLPNQYTPTPPAPLTSFWFHQQQRLMESGRIYTYKYVVMAGCWLLMFTLLAAHVYWFVGLFTQVYGLFTRIIIDPASTGAPTRTTSNGWTESPPTSRRSASTWTATASSPPPSGARLLRSGGTTGTRRQGCGRISSGASIE